MIHCWIVLQPVDSDWPGLSRFLTGEDDRALIGQIYRILAAIGAEVPEIPTTRANSAWHLRQQRLLLIPPHEMRSGLAIEVFPCSANGENLDTDPVEPSGE